MLDFYLLKALHTAAGPRTLDVRLTLAPGELLAVSGPSGAGKTTLLRLLAGLVPFAAEETWSWFRDGSVHRAPWPVPAGGAGDPAVLAACGEALIGIRRAKSDAKVSQRAPVASVRITGPDRLVALVALAAGDVRSAGRISALEFASSAGEAIEVSDVVFTPTETD